MRGQCLIALALLATLALTICYAGDNGCGPASIPTIRRGMAGAPTVEVYGTISAIDGAKLTIKTRDGKSISIDAKPVASSIRITPPNLGLSVMVLATRGPHRVLLAQTINRAKSAPAAWPPDCYEPTSQTEAKAIPVR